MTARSRWTILALAVVGLGFASYSTFIHYKLLTDASYVSVCDLSSAFNCSQVYLSQYGSVSGVPVSIAGMLWFAMVAAIAALAVPDKASPAGSYIFLLSIVGLAVILFLGFKSFVELKTGCVLCMGTYVAVIGIFIVSAMTPSLPIARIPGRLAGDLTASFRDPSGAVAAVVIVVGTGALVAAFPKEGSRPAPPAPSASVEAAAGFEAAWALQPRIDLGIPADGAKVIVVKFNDYECGACRVTHGWYKPVLEKFEKSNPGAVKYVLKDWPWHRSCNFNTTADAHDGACEAAAAVRMARDQGKAKADEMETWIFANQTTLDPASVKAAAAKILGIKDFDRQYQLKLPDIRKDVADGGALSIRATPTLFINGVRIDEVMPAEFFERAIQIEIKKADGK